LRSIRTMADSITLNLVAMFCAVVMVCF
jgi:hypothetical protein